MGIPPAHHLANGQMSQFDSTLKGTSTLYTRYMDDILCECKAGEVGGKLAEVNQLHPSLKFTIERETSCEILFLDMKIMRTFEQAKICGVNMVHQTNRHWSHYELPCIGSKEI